MWARGIQTLMLASVLMISPVVQMAKAGGELQTVATSKSFPQLQKALEAAVTANDMFVVTRACASCGAAQRDVSIPGNMVIGVYRNDFAVRMLEASVPAGIEAPIRFYLTENGDGTASLSYRLPSAIFQGYGSAELDSMAKELDSIWEKIVAGAVN